VGKRNYGLFSKIFDNLPSTVPPIRLHALALLIQTLEKKTPITPYIAAPLHFANEFKKHMAINMDRHELLQWLSLQPPKHLKKVLVGYVEIVVGKCEGNNGSKSLCEENENFLYSLQK